MGHAGEAGLAHHAAQVSEDEQKLLLERIPNVGKHEVAALAERRRTLQRLRAEGVEPYPSAFVNRSETAAIRREHVGLAAGEHPTVRYRVAGRLTARRGHGKTSFLELTDRSGSLQLFVRADALGQASYDRLLELDIGDVVGVDGCLYVTRRGEISLKVLEWTLLAKALRPPPDRHHGIRATDLRSRQRELDLLSSAEVRAVFMTRARIIGAVRRWLDRHGFVEVETPVLQPIYGGALARPFTTHHHTLDREVYLRIATELYLKRCIVGGLENVYDLGKCFRNEGISHKHNPEFTMVEWFQTYAGYLEAACFTERLLVGVAEEVLGTRQLAYDGATIDLAPPWRRVTLRDALREHCGIDVLAATRAELCAALGDDGADPQASWGRLVAALFSKHVEPTLVQPTFVLDLPTDVWPIARSHRDEPRLAEAWEIFIGGMELSSGCSDLNDADEQRTRFVHQRVELAPDPEEVHPHDEDFVHALEYGMPPAAGVGVGLDRLVMLLTGRRFLRDVVLFPTIA
jgi:lysyl-tRNA synthetase class 2